jgi:hypothetical protein
MPAACLLCMSAARTAPFPPPCADCVGFLIDSRLTGAAQVRIPATGGRLFIASDGIWDAFPPSKAVPKVRRIGPADCGPTLFARIVERYGDYMDDTTLIGARRVKMRTDPTAADGHALHEVMG